MALFSKERILYYSGCVARFKLKKQVELYKKILDKIGIRYAEMEDFLCCGNKVYDLGYETEANKLIRRNLKIFKEHKITKIITNCPECYRFFSKAKELPDWDIEVEVIAITILRELDKKKKLIKNPGLNEQIIYHHNCYLKNENRLVKELLKLLGYGVVDLDKCCGACGSLYLTNLELANKISEKMLKKINDKVVAIGDCYWHLSSLNKAEVVELSEIVAKCLGIEVEEK